ncbi:hypothetical protein Ae201684_013240 [Aphanomyces euteiches]|uniref:Uncharacterized protein n=1 Tax=Aphanomyces euteiches TaxID=100861 RepID=A0A6G0WP44_9STRA|nr:hypothetical protein Ae201684_013240 [Aphanomyces euteiches]
MTTFAVAPVQVENYSHNLTTQSHDILTPLNEFQKKGCKDILQATPIKGAFATSKSCFVLGAIEAYNKHHNLVIRPDDVWLAIMVQFGFFVNGNAETLRDSLVKHQGQKELRGWIWYLMEEHLVDPSMREWILPSFSTTTDHDRIVGSVVMMATMKKYFKYTFGLLCDWEAIRSRVDHLKPFGGHMVEWVEMLSGVLGQFVASAKGDVSVDFWQRICHYYGGGSGPPYISGWISVFCVFNEDGKWQGSTDFDGWGKPTKTDYPAIDTNSIPVGYLTVDVKINDNGVEHKALMFAGHMAFQVEDGNTIVPHLSWAIALKNGIASEE